MSQRRKIATHQNNGESITVMLKEGESCDCDGLRDNLIPLTDCIRKCGKCLSVMLMDRLVWCGVPIEIDGKDSHKSTVVCVCVCVRCYLVI